TAPVGYGPGAAVNRSLSCRLRRGRRSRWCGRSDWGGCQRHDSRMRRNRGCYGLGHLRYRNLEKRVPWIIRFDAELSFCPLSQLETFRDIQSRGERTARIGFCEFDRNLFCINGWFGEFQWSRAVRSEEHTSELQSR